MTAPVDPIQPLRDALRVSPNNLPLRQHLAHTLSKLGRLDEAQKEYQDALSLSPHNAELKLGLAHTFAKQAKASAALVIVEELQQQPDPPAGAFILHARLLLVGGDTARASRQYRRALELDPALADPELEKDLDLKPIAQTPSGDRGTPDPVDDTDPAGRVKISTDESDSTRRGDLERPRINFSDVGGMEKLKDEIRIKIIHPLTHADIYKAYGKPIGGGILLYGPPGCGKTHLARATAGEVNAGFLSIGINDVLDMWLGNSERNLHQLFEQARRNKPCVLFFDEVDALGASRTDMRQHGGRQVINQFLSELDGAESSNEGLLILAATNAPWHLDSAFRRPGRFDRILFVPPPDAPARAAILHVLLKGKPLQSIDYDQVAKKTDDFSGADLKAVVDQAVEAKLRDALRQGIPAPLTTKDLLAAAKSLRPTTKEWFATARNYALYSNQGGIYDDILAYLKLV